MGRFRIKSERSFLPHSQVNPMGYYVANTTTTYYTSTETLYSGYFILII